MSVVKEKSDIINLILGLRCNYMCVNIDEPTEVHLTKQNEIELFRKMLDYFPRHTDEGVILRHYGMRAWEKILGMKTIWDSDYLRIC